MKNQLFLITLAGPQSAGKTTAFNFIKKKYPQANFIEEINPYTFQKDHLGGALTNKQLEKKIIETDLANLKQINQPLTFVETGIFHLVYGEKILGLKIANDYFIQYQKLNQRFNHLIIFIDTKPEISWQRRQLIYQKRVTALARKDQIKMLTNYQKNIYQLYPLWLKWLKKIPYQKIIIKNSFKNQEVFLDELEKKIIWFLNSC